MGGEGPRRMLALTGWNRRRLFIVTLTSGCSSSTTKRLFRQEVQLSWTNRRNGRLNAFRLTKLGKSVSPDLECGALNWKASIVLRWFLIMPAANLWPHLSKSQRAGKKNLDFKCVWLIKLEHKYTYCAACPHGVCVCVWVEASLERTHF